MEFQQGQAIGLTDCEGFHAIKNHPVLVGTAWADTTVQIKGRAATHQHLALPNR